MEPNKKAVGHLTERPEWLDEAETFLIRYCGAFSPVLAEQAQGARIFTSDGRSLLDFTSGQMCAIVGHNHPAVIEAMQTAATGSLHLLSTMLSPSVVDLCRQLCDILPPGLDKAILVNTGSESNEVALRMARLASGRFEMVGFMGSWHGMTGGAQSTTYSHTREGYGPVLPGSLAIPAPYAYRCPIRHCQGTCDHSCLEVGFEQIDHQSVGSLAAMIAEPILSAAGIIELSESYMKRLKELCEERGMYLILDEAQTALGRTGFDFALEHGGVTPDFLALSKTLGGGLPLAATVTSQTIEETCFEKGFIYITSHVSDPLPAAIGLAMLRLLKEEQLSRRAREMGAHLRRGLEALQETHECIGEVRGRGLLLGMEIVWDRENKTPGPDLGWAISQRCLELGLSMNIVRLPGMSGTFRIAPPLTITREEINTGLDILDQAIRECWNEADHPC